MEPITTYFGSSFNLLTGLKKKLQSVLNFGSQCLLETPGSLLEIISADLLDTLEGVSE